MPKKIALLWAVVLCFFSFYLVNQLVSGIKIETSLLKLLPHLETNPQIAKALKKFRQNRQNKVIFLLTGENKETIKTLEELNKLIQQSLLFKDIQYKTKKQPSLYPILSPYRFNLLTDEFRTQLINNQTQQIIEQTWRKLYSPFSSLYSGQIKQDPFFHFFDYLNQFSGLSQKISIKTGYFTLQNQQQTYYLLIADLKDSPFSQKNQQSFKKLLQHIEFLKKQTPQISWLSSGVIYHAIAGFDSAQGEISSIGLGSLLGIIILLFLAFRGFMPLIASTLVIAIGILMGFLACLTWFNEIHLLTLVFGASLIGVSIDYSFHYFVELYYGKTNKNNVLNVIFYAILLGLITSLIAYFALSLTQLPLLQQVAVFSCTGLVASFLSVILFFPLLKIRPQKTRPFWIAPFLQKISDFWKLKMSLLLLIILLMPLITITIDNDIRHFQSLNKTLVNEEQKIKDLLDLKTGFKYFIIQQETIEAVLQKEEALSKALKEPYLSISKLVPSVQYQQQNNQLLKKIYQTPSPLVTDYFNQFDLSFSNFQEIRNNKILTVDDLKDTAIYQPYQDLLQKTATGYLSIIALSGTTHHLVLEKIAHQQDLVFIDDVNTIKIILNHHQNKAIYLVIMAYLVIGLLLLLRYPWKKALSIILVPLFSALIALSLTALMGIPLNLFNTLALILVLGIGIDYSLFFAEHKENTLNTFFAISLSAISTLLSFGLLALSATPVVASFGLMVLIGILIAFFFSPLVSTVQS